MLVPRIHDFVGDRRGLRKDSEPTEWIDALVSLRDGSRQRLAADAVKAVATGNELARQSVRFAILYIGNGGRRAVEVVQPDILGFIDNDAAHPVPGRVEIPGDFGLPVNRDCPAVDQRVEVEPQGLAAKRDLDTAVRLALCVEALAHVRLSQQLDRALLEHARPDPAKHILATAPLEDDGVDSREMQQLRQQQAGGPATNDCDLGPVSRQWIRSETFFLWCRPSQVKRDFTL